MIDTTILAAKFPLLNDEAFLKELSENAIYKEAEEGETIMDVGSSVTFMPLMLHGTIKVLRDNEDGDEIFLYYLESGNLCASSLTCNRLDKKSTIRAVAETDCEFLAVPSQLMEDWMQRFKIWRNFVLNAYSSRFEELLNAVDMLAFKKMDQRIEEYLLNKAEVNKSKTLKLSHQDIAFDLNTSREVVSRILKQMENLNKVTLKRGSIVLP